MSLDTSVRSANGSSQRLADSVLRATAGAVATLLMPPLAGDASDAGQLGMNQPQLQQLRLGPAVFRRTRAIMQEGSEARYELTISASSVEQQVSQLQLDSANTLFLMAAGVFVGGGLFQIESWSSSQSLGEAFIYRLLLRSAEPEATTSMT